MRNSISNFTLTCPTPQKSNDTRGDMFVRVRRASTIRLRRASTLKIRNASVIRLRRPARNSCKKLVQTEPVSDTMSVASGNNKIPRLRRCSTMLASMARRSIQRTKRTRTNSEDCTAASETEDHTVEELAENQSALHMACLTYPTVEMIEKIVEDFPELLFQTNSLGQTALHVAVASGASPRVVNLLLKHYGEAASMQDDNGRTPLHLACSCKKLCDAGFAPCARTRDLRKGPSYAVVKALCFVAPKTVNLEDDDGMSALEYAICCGTTPNVLRVLHKTSERVWTGASTTGIKFAQRHSMVDLSPSTMVLRPDLEEGKRDSLLSVSARKLVRSLPPCQSRTLSIPRTVNV